MENHLLSVGKRAIVVPHSQSEMLTDEERRNLQERTLRNNFHVDGCRLHFIDLHPMLDCGPDRIGRVRRPFRDPFRRQEDPVPVDDRNREGLVGVGLAKPLILRQEFFGGIAYDIEYKRAHYFDHSAFAVLERIAGAERGILSTDAISAQSQNERSAYNALFEDGLIAVGSDANAFVHHMKDKSINHLQSPLLVEIELTMACHRSCRHCAYGSSPQSSREGELSSEQWRSVFEKLADQGVAIVQFTGGDPFFRSDALEIMAAADALGLVVYPRSDTAALNTRLLSGLSGLRNLWIVGTSCDGADAEQHDWMRGSGAFDLFVKRARAMAEASVPFVVGATLHKGNYRTVRKMGCLATELGASHFDIGFLAPVGRASTMESYVCDAIEIGAALQEYLDGLRAGEYSAFQSHYDTRIESGIGVADLVELMPAIPYLTEWPFSRMRVDPKGNVYTAGKVRGSVLSRGYNALHDGIDDIWMHSPNLHYLRRAADGCRIHALDYRTIGEHIHV